MQAVANAATSRHQLSPESASSVCLARHRAIAVHVCPLLAASTQTATALFSRPGVIEIDQEARTKANVALIETEFKNHRRLYEYKLYRAGIASPELEDALAEMFSLAIRWVGSYDSRKSSISSWLGNQVARTVASSTYGARRPGWRRQQEQELSTEMLMTGVASELVEMTIDGSDDEADQTEDLAVAAFLGQLSDALTVTEAAAIDICGMDLLHERFTMAQLDRVRDLLGVRSLSAARNFTQKLGNKMRELALKHFDAQDLMGRPGFDKLAA
ncbi:hypothetical protein ACU4GI_26430 [Cupriavidus basilensis]